MTPRANYCTFWSEGDWPACCRAHDADFAAGMFWEANSRLFQCVGSVDGVMAPIMWAGVSTIGYPFFLAGRPLDPAIATGLFLAVVGLGALGVFFLVRRLSR